MLCAFVKQLRAPNEIQYGSSNHRPRTVGEISKNVETLQNYNCSRTEYTVQAPYGTFFGFINVTITISVDSSCNKKGRVFSFHEPLYIQKPITFFQYPVHD